MTARSEKIWVGCEFEGCDQKAEADRFQVQSTGLFFSDLLTDGLRLPEGWGTIIIKDTHDRQLIAIRCPAHLKTKPAAPPKKKKKEKTDEE